MLVAIAERQLGQSRTCSGEIDKDHGYWSYDNTSDFLADVVTDRSSLWLYFKGEPQSSLHIQQRYGSSFSWKLRDVSKSQIIDFEREADSLINQHWIKDPPIESGASSTSENLVVFIGHGRSQDWRDLKDHLHDKHGIEVEAYEIGSRAGHAIRDILQQMLDRSSMALLVHTPDDEMANGDYSARANVIHETGLFQGRLGFSRAVVLRKDGTTEFSNLAGLQEFRYTDIKQTFGDVVAWINREVRRDNSVTTRSSSPRPGP